MYMNAQVGYSSVVSETQRSLFQNEGYMILESVIPEPVLQVLREECSYFMGYSDAEMDARSARVDGISRRGNRYFIANKYRLRTRMASFIFSSLMADITTACLGSEVYLFNEQWVVKGAEKGMKFGWHQDSGYIKFEEGDTRHKPYVTCWCTLDDVTEENGTVYLLPHSRGNTHHTIVDHAKEEGTNDLVGYTGSDPGIPIIVRAGSIVVFTSLNFHRSGSNSTKRMRRVYLPQYSSEAILNRAGRFHCMAVPFVSGGELVYDPGADRAEKYGGVAGID